MSENLHKRRDDQQTQVPLLWADIDSVEALRALVADDGYATSFQSIGQYRAALLRYLEPLALATEMTGATIRTWRQRIGVNKEWPLHAPNDVERAMVAEIVALRLAIAPVFQAVKPWQQRIAESGKRECAELAVECLMVEVAELRMLVNRPMIAETGAPEASPGAQP